MQKRKIAGKLLDAYKMGADYVEFAFKNGSHLDLGNVRGLRRESLIFEEIIEQFEAGGRIIGCGYFPPGGRDRGKRLFF